MRLATPCPEQSPVSCPVPLQAPTGAVTDVTPEDVRKMILYLRKARDRAVDIRDRSPAGSYLESVLIRTIDGITLELSQLDYLLATKPVKATVPGTPSRRMRQAI